MIRCLGQFIPSRYDGSTIAVELRDWLADRGIEPQEPQIGVRSPEGTRDACESTPVLLEWHRDGAGPDPTNPDVVPAIQRLIVWSNKTPTQLRIPLGAVTTWPLEVILFDNVKVWHRSPPPEEGRWFVRIADPKVNR